MSKVLLLDTNLSSAPIYDYLLQTGNEVYVCGGNPEDTLATHASNYIDLDYSNTAKLFEKILSFGIDYLVPGCNDLSYRVCAEVNANGQFPGLDTREVTEVINNKDSFKQFATKVGLPVPRAIPIHQIGDIWPIIVKPVDAYSGRGVSIIYGEDKAQLSNAIFLAIKFSASNSYIIEEFVTGQLYSHSAFISGHTIVKDFIVEEHCTANSFAVDTSRVVIDFSKNILQRVRECILKMATELKLVDGLLHTQFIVNGPAIWIIEVTRRCPGDLYSKLIEKSTGFPYAQAYAYPFLNHKAMQFDGPLVFSYLMRHTISQPNDGTFQSLQFHKPIKIESFVPMCKTGSMIKASPFGRIGILFAEASSESELEELIMLSVERKLYSIL